MENKKVGIAVIAITGTLLAMTVSLVNGFGRDLTALGCFQNPSCQPLQQSLSLTHFAFGAFGFLFALGFYLIFFSRGEESIVKRLEADTSRKLDQDKFSILMKGLNDYEKKVVSAVKEQNGITQSTLRLRVDMSKAKLSQVLTELEKKNLVRREPENKTLAIYWKENT